MKTSSKEFESTASRTASPTRRVPLHAAARSHEQVSAAAVDEVFANLARLQDRVERSNERGLDPAPFRNIAIEMDRQRDHLAQLLRDIDAPASE